MMKVKFQFQKFIFDDKILIQTSEVYIQWQNFNLNFKSLFSIIKL